MKSYKSRLLKGFLWGGMDKLSSAKVFDVMLLFSLLLFDVWGRRVSVKSWWTEFLFDFFQVKTPFLEAKDSRSFLTDQILIFCRFYLLSPSLYVFFIEAHVLTFQWRSWSVSFCTKYVLTHSFLFHSQKILKCSFSRFFKCVIEFSLRALIIRRHDVIFKIIIFRVQ